VDVNVIAEHPRLAESKHLMRERLARVLGLPIHSVSVKARTAEGLGPVGRGEAIEVQAVVLMDEG
jgi:2-C-methyl-D-erythritol 2,4-cyclodiphosphate synthase